MGFRRGPELEGAGNQAQGGDGQVDRSSGRKKARGPFSKFEEHPYDPEWNSDKGSWERQVAITDVVNLLETALRYKGTRHLCTRDLEHPEGKVFPVTNKSLRIGNVSLSGYPPIARKITGTNQKIGENAKFTRWEIPAGDGYPLYYIYLRIKGSDDRNLSWLFGEMRATTSEDGDPRFVVNRALIERSRNKIGSFFKQESSG